MPHSTLLGKKVGGLWPPRPPQFCRAWNFQYAGIPSTEANRCAKIFTDNRIADPHDLSREILVEKREVNEKRRAFYKTVEELAVKKAYKQKAAKKIQITNQLAELKLSKKVSLRLETIQNLIKLLD